MVESLPRYPYDLYDEWNLDNINDAIDDLRFSDHPGRLMLNF